MVDRIEALENIAPHLEELDLLANPLFVIPLVCGGQPSSKHS